MAQINCKNCHKEMPDITVNCPSCGYPVGLTPYKPLGPPPTKMLGMEGITYEIPSTPTIAELSQRFKWPERNEVEYVAVESQSNIARCPKCSSPSLSTSQQGFGLGKAAVGGFIFGAPGLLGGLIGRKSTIITCLKCGHHWKP